MYVYLVNAKQLAPKEKAALHERLSGSAFMVINYLGKNNNALEGFVVYWDMKPETFTNLALSIPRCDYVDATEWLIDNDFIDQAFYAAFGHQ